MKITKGFKIWS